MGEFFLMGFTVIKVMPTAIVFGMAATVFLVIFVPLLVASLFILQRNAP